MSLKVKTFIILIMLLSNYAYAQQTLKLAIFYPPSKDSIIQKFIVESYKQLNIQIEFIYLPAERSLWMANKNIIDGESARIANLNDNYPDLFMLKTPIDKISLYVYTRKDMNLKVNGWQSIKSYRIAYLRGGKAVERHLKGAGIQSVFTLAQAFTMLEHKRVDIVIEKANQANNYPNIQMLTPAVYSFYVYHYLHKKHAHLIPPLEKAFKKIIANKITK